MNSKYSSGSWNVGGVPISGANRYFIGTSALGAMTGALKGTSNFLDNAWDDTPDKFQQLGSDAGGIANELIQLPMLGMMGAQHFRTLGTTDGAVVGGNTYQKLAKGGWEAVGHRGKPLAEAEMKSALKEAGNFKVNVKGGAPYKGGFKGITSRLGGTYRPMGWRGIAGTMAVSMLAGMGASMALGFAGKVLDSAYSESRHFRKPQYDNRFFNTQQNDQSSYQTLGMAMDNYENRMLSVSRIYHSRG